MESPTIPRRGRAEDERRHQLREAWTLSPRVQAWSKNRATECLHPHRRCVPYAVHSVTVHRGADDGDQWSIAVKTGRHSRALKLFLTMALFRLSFLCCQHLWCPCRQLPAVEGIVPG